MAVFGGSDLDSTLGRIDRHDAKRVAEVGNIGADVQGSFTVIGDTIDLAAHLQTRTQPGEVVIGPRTHEDLHGRAAVVPLGAAGVKGKREPVPVYRLVSVTGRRRSNAGTIWTVLGCDAGTRAAAWCGGDAGDGVHR